MTRIESNRLYMRPLQQEDATEKYAGWLNDSEVNRFLESRHQWQDIDSCRRFIQACNDDARSHLFGIFLKENDEHIGNAKIGSIDERYQRGQISYLIGEKEYWGGGLTTEAVRALTRYGFEGLGLHRIEAGCYEHNLGSLRVLRKAGYTVEGFLRNHVISEGRREGCFWLAILADEHH